MSDIHSCSYHCNRPECIKAQRDELRERLAQPEQEPIKESSITHGHLWIGELYGKEKNNG